MKVSCIQLCSSKNIKNNFILTNPFLIISKMHPEILIKYKLFFNFKNNFFKETFFFLRNLIIKIYFVFIHFFFLYLRDFFLLKKNKLIKENLDILIISNLNNKRQIGKDTYFRSFISKIDKNLKYKIIYIDSSNLDVFQKNKIINSHKIILNKYTNFYYEILILIKQFYYAFYYLIRSIADQEKKFYLSLFYSFFSGQYRFNLITCHQIYKIFKKNNIKNCLQIFEGNAIDFSIIHTIKKNSYKTKCIGFYHPGLYKNNISLLNENNNLPDALFTSSYYSKEFFKKNSIIKNIYNIDYSFPIKKSYNKLNIKNPFLITFVVEGLREEENLMISYAKKIYLMNNNYKFNFLFHPNHDNLKLKKVIFEAFNNDASIYLFSHDSDYLFATSEFLIYRGSSRVFDLVANYSMRPIYYDFNKNLNIDPLYKIKNSWKINALNENIFLKKEIKKFIYKDKIRTIKFCQNFYKDNNNKEFLNILNK